MTYITINMDTNELNALIAERIEEIDKDKYLPYDTKSARISELQFVQSLLHNITDTDDEASSKEEYEIPFGAKDSELKGSTDKIMRIPFDIKYRPQIESGEYKIETRDRKPVRIICWDRFTTEHSDNIVALVTGTKSESTYYYYQDGHLWNKANGEGDSSLDLFIIIPEAELTDLERAIKRGMLCAGLQGVSTTIIKETAKEVKDIICKGCTANIDGYIKGQGDAEKDYQRGYMDGYKAAEESKSYHYPAYEPPCHHGGICTNPFKDCINCPRQSSGATTNTTTSGTCKKED